MTSSRSLALATLGAALFVGALAPLAASAQQLNVQGTPNYGARNIAPGFTPDPMSIAIVSGGTINVTALGHGGDCQGFATAQPDFNFTLTGVSQFLRVFVDAGNEDTTLVINKPDGSWACNDDANGGRNPVVDFSGAPRGLYNVWVGSYQTGTRARGTLNITELRNRLPGGGTAAPTGPTPTGPTGPTPTGTTALTISGRPNFGSRTVVPGFRRDPMRINVMSGGNVNVQALNLGQNCTGFSTAQPDLNFTLGGTSPSLRVYVDRVRGNGDTTLIINKPDGTWICNDDSYGGRNPTIDLAGAPPGIYNVWIGSYQSGVQARGRLNITELPNNHP